MTSSYLLEFIYLLLAAVIAVPVSQAIKLGAVPGFLLAGLAVGPFGFGVIKSIETITHIAEFGVVLLLFIIGMEMKPSFLWSIRRLVFGLGSLQLLLTGAAITLIAIYLFDVSTTSAILIGPALALSSTAFVLQLLNEQKAINSEYGRSAVAVLLLQDLAVVPLLALIPLLSDTQSNDGNLLLAFAQSIGILVLLVAIGRYLLNPILHAIAKAANAEVFTASAILIVMGTAWLTEHAGLSMAMGAFLAGLLISDSAYRHQIRAEVQPFRGLLLGMFFMAMGMSLNLNVFFQSPLSILGLVAILVLVKFALLWPMARTFGLNNNKSMATALILSQGGEFALVLFSLAFQSKVLSQSEFDTLLLVVLFSMLFTPVLAMLAKRLNQTARGHEQSPSELPASAIIIAGYGRVGRRIGEVLTKANLSFVAIDRDAKQVKRYQELGHPVVFGDVTQPEILNSVGIKAATMIIVTVNEAHAAESVVEVLNRTNPDIQIYARGHNSDTCRKLKSLGAFKIVSENLEASLELTRYALAHADINLQLQHELLDNFKQDYYRQIEQEGSQNTAN